MAKSQQISLNFNLEDTKGYKEIISRLDALEAILQDLKSAKAPPQEHIEQWLNIKQVMEYIGVSHSTLYHWMRDGTFPKGELLGPKSRRWRLSEIFPYLTAGSLRSRDTACGTTPDSSHIY